MVQPTLFLRQVVHRGRVYFLRSNAYVKIGYTARDKARLRELATGNPEPMEWIGSIPAPENYDKVLHADPRFAPFRSRPDGEWFYATPEVMGAIEQLLRDAAAAEAESKPLVIRHGDLVGPWEDGTYLRADIKNLNGVPTLLWDSIEGYQAEAIKSMAGAGAWRVHLSGPVARDRVRRVLDLLRGGREAGG
jgi:hypothetical protein